jgi:Poly(3-hydroxyalkanoate) synthetase
MGHLRGMREPEYANTPRELVYSEDKLKVWHFTGHGKTTAKTPLLIVYALVNTVWMTTCKPTARWCAICWSRVRTST